MANVIFTATVTSSIHFQWTIFGVWGVRLSPLGTAATLWLFVPAPDDDCGEFGGMRIDRGNRSTRRKPAPSATLSTTNPIWPDSGSNPGLRGGKPATNRLSYGTANPVKFCFFIVVVAVWVCADSENALICAKFSEEPTEIVQQL
jgi:hypothetical protein